MRPIRLLPLAAALMAACATHATSAGPGVVAPGELPDAATVAAREQTADQQVRHVLARLTFGARPGDVEKVRAMGVDRWIALQLHPERIDDRATDALMARYETLQLTPGQLIAAYTPPQQLLQEKRRELARQGVRPNAADVQNKRGAFLLTREDSLRFREAARKAQRVPAELASARVARAVTSERQLQEVMTDFWLDHFNVFAGKGGPERYYLADYEYRVIAPHALGRFRDLLGAVAHSPAMLYYLDNWESAADSAHPTLAGARRPRAARRGLNENYGRELLELHTLGVDGGYTQQDVINVARAFTGWTIEQPRQGGGFVFRPQMHDAGPKLVLGHALPPGRGIEDGEQVLDILARQPATAHFIATKLVRHFVSDSAPPALVDRAARTFLATDGDLRAVMRTIIESPEFFSRAAYHAKVKSPFELVVSALRAVDAPADTTARTAQIIARLGEPLFGHRDPNGYPDAGDAWINTGSILERINFGLAFAARRIPDADPLGWPDAVKLAHAPRAEQVDGVIGALLGGEASPDTRRILESGRNPLLGASHPDTLIDVTAPEDAAAPRMHPSSPNGPTGLAELVGLALGAPEFQRK